MPRSGSAARLFVKVKDGKTLLFDAKYRDLWAEVLPRGDAVSTGDLRAQPEAAWQSNNSISYDELSCTGFGHSNTRTGWRKYAREVVQRPVNLARLAELVTPGYGIPATKQKHEFALNLLANPS